MIPKWPYVRLARITMQLETPLSVASGAFHPLYDTPLVQDANGLPTIPGTSLAGAIRARLPDAPLTLFGNLEQSAQLEFSFAHIHDQQNCPVDGLELDRSSLLEDGILRPLLVAQPLRQHVRINEGGTAADTGKFDRCIVPGGHRFSFELRLCTETVQHGLADWEMIRTQLIENPPFLGGGSRSGLGRVRVRRWLEGGFDLTQPGDFERWIRLTRRLDTKPGELTEVSIPNVLRWEGLTLNLQPAGGWRIGDGTIPLGQGRRANRLPLTEMWVDWKSVHCHEEGALRQVILVPGSGIKGALRHRSLFHLCRLKSWFAEDPHTVEKANERIAEMFGWAANSASEPGQAGRIRCEDIPLPCEGAAPKTYTHNSIDRFSQGGRRGRLFSEEVLAGQSAWCVRISLDDPKAVELEVRQAFLLALKDLASGELAVGAGAGRGQGFLEEAGEVDWDMIKRRLDIA